MCEAPFYAQTVMQYVALADHQQALAEKDQLIERLKQEAETHAQEARTVKQLMAQAVRFAVACVEHYVLHTSANAFLNSPEARAFLKEHHEHL